MTSNALSHEKIEKAAYILKALASPIRLQIINLLRYHEELTVNQISDQLKAEQSYISHNLSHMRLKKILSCRRAGKNIYYQLRMQQVLKVLDCMEECELDL